MKTMKSKPKKTTKPKPKARKQTSSRVSSAAGRLMEMCEGDGNRFWIEHSTAPWWTNVTRLVKMVAASAMSQDEKGKRCK
jgi:hypothetical protein